MKKFTLKVPMTLNDERYCNGCDKLVWNGCELCTCTDLGKVVWADAKTKMVPRHKDCRLEPASE